MKETSVHAQWDDAAKYYRADPFGPTGSHWFSPDGDNWTEFSGLPCESPQFKNCTIYLHGGLRDCVQTR